MVEASDRALTWALMFVAYHWPLLLYSLVTMATAVRAYIAPSRPILLFLYGSLLLITAHEYERSSRTSVVNATEQILGIDSAADLALGIRWFLMLGVPAILRALGFGLLGLSVVLREMDLRRRSRPRRVIFVDL